MRLLKPPLSGKEVQELKAGDLVAISGRIITFRDRAYTRVSSGQKPPLDLKGWIVYHCGPLAKREKGKIKILSAGPTTSARLDDMQVDFLRRTGVRCLIGKGGVGNRVARELRNLGCVYLAFTGGAGVLAAEAIDGVERVLWEDLGDLEALWVLRVEGFGPLVVAIDLHGGNLYLKAR
jgi:tartrate/fumarate subfamily iron-sulfur-dependent hydro-lyase beta chain